MGRTPDEKLGLHPRNRHRGRYDFPRLVAASPALAPFVAKNAYGDESIDFADPAAVKALNGAILKLFYGVSGWDLPPGYLCPPIPGRADYVHHVADLLGACAGGEVPRGARVQVLDVGVGANCVYPLVGHGEYGWSFLGSDVDPVALAAAERTVRASGLAGAIRLRRQQSPSHVLRNLLKEGEELDATMCNPPFHASLAEAQEGSRRKWRNLGKAPARASAEAPVQNFGGRGGELWCPGGEAAFLQRMIEESVALAQRVLWFTSLVSKEATLPGVSRALARAKVAETLTIGMAQGQKKSRLVAWTFLAPAERTAWAARRWGATKKADPR